MTTKRPKTRDVYERHAPRKTSHPCGCTNCWPVEPPAEQAGILVRMPALTYSGHGLFGARRHD